MKIKIHTAVAQRSLQRRLDEVTVDMKLLSKSFSEAVKKCQEREKLLKKSKVIIFKQACQFYLATRQSNIRKRAQRGGYNTLSIDSVLTIFVVENVKLKQSIKSLRGQMKKEALLKEQMNAKRSTLSCKNNITNRSVSLSAASSFVVENAKLKKFAAMLKWELTRTQCLNDDISVQLRKDQEIKEDYIQVSVYKFHSML